MPRASAYNSPAAAIALAADSDKVHPLPVDVQLSAPAHRIYNELQKSRAHSKWSTADLHTLARIARFEQQIRNAQKQLDDMIDAGSDPFLPETLACEYLKNIERASKTQLTLLRSIGVTKANQRPPSATDANQAEIQQTFATADKYVSFLASGPVQQI